MSETVKPRPAEWAAYENQLYHLRKIADHAGRLIFGRGLGSAEDRVAIRQHFRALGIRDIEGLRKLQGPPEPEVPPTVSGATPLGVVRRIDDLGRVVIPKELRRAMGIDHGTPLEILTSAEATGEGEREIVLRKYDRDTFGRPEADPV